MLYSITNSGKYICSGTMRYESGQSEEHKRMRIVIFGIGEIYKKNKKNIAEGDTVVAFIDNNEKVQGKDLEGSRIYSPLHIHKINYDKILIMSNYALEMKKQLLKLGCQEDKILHYTEYISRQKKGKIEVYFAYKEKNVCNYLIITTSLGYHGGSIVAAYAALELQSRGHRVVIAAPEGNMQFINEFRNKGITFFIYPNLCFAKWDELFWVEDFQKIIVNTYPMMLCALEIGKYRNVLMWLHESEIAYSSLEFWKNRILKDMLSSKLYFYAVSDVARKNFIANVAECEIKLLPYGIPDLSENIKKQRKNKLTFALVGTIDPIKQQLLYLEAIKMLNIVYQKENEFLIIGEIGGNKKYAEKVKKEINTFESGSVEYVGGLGRKDMERAYSQIDVLVIASAQETMSLVATEAMMYGKPCIICDVAGMSMFVKHGKNGLICRTNDAESLAEQMEYCIINRERLYMIGEEARKTYNKYFTMEILGNSLENEMKNI